MGRRGRRKRVNLNNRGRDGSVEWHLIECDRVQEGPASAPAPSPAPFVDFLGIGGSDNWELGFSGRVGIAGEGLVGRRLMLNGGLERDLKEEMGSGIDLKLFEKWRGRVSENLVLNTDLCLLSDFASDKMLWKRVAARLRFEAMYKPRFGRDSVNWRNWFVEPDKIVDDRKDDCRHPLGVEVTLLDMMERKVKKFELNDPFIKVYKRIVKRRKKETEAEDKGLVKWTPAGKCVGVRVPSLSDLSFAFLAEYCEGLVSLENVPLQIKHKLCRAACDYGKMNFEFMKIVVNGAPSEICVPDCSWMATKQFTEIFFACDFKNLKVLHLAMCWQCNFDRALMSDVFPSGVLRALVSLSLKGAVQLTDQGLGYIVQLAPTLRSLDISQCPLVSAMGINVLGIWYGKTLEELYIDDCPGIDATAMTPALTKFLNLHVLSVARNYSVCDEFVRHFVDVRGSCIKELVLSSCKKLTDATIEIIGSACSSLVSLGISNIQNLTDWSLLYIARDPGCIRQLDLSHNAFRRQEGNRQTLQKYFWHREVLLMSGIAQVGPATAFSLANFTQNLFSLDLSQCNHITEDILGHIVTSCMSLRLLKIYGCQEITNRFLNGHTNPNLEIVGASPLSQQESAC